MGLSEFLNNRLHTYSEGSMKYIGDELDPKDYSSNKRVVFAKNGAYDLETKGFSGKYVWIGYEHGRYGASESKMRQVILDAAEEVNRKVFNGKGHIDDKWDTHDMYRVWVSE